MAILVLVLVAIAHSWKRGGFESSRPNLRHPVVIGAIFWAGAAFLGLGVALGRGNDVVLVSGQVLAMALLPLGFIAGLGFGRDPWPGLAKGVMIGGGVAVIIHLGYWAYQVSQGAWTTRLLLPNSINLSGVALLGLLLSLTVAGAAPGVWRAWGKLAAGAFLLFILGSGTRGLWLVAPPTVALMGAMSRVWNPRKIARYVFRAALAMFPLGLLIGLLLVWWHNPRPIAATTAELLGETLTVHESAVSAEDSRSRAFNWHPRSPEDREVLSGRVPVEGRRGYRLDGRLSGRGQGVAMIHLIWLDPQQRRVSSRVDMIALGGEKPVRIVGVAPSNACWIRVTVSYVGEPGAHVQLSGLTLEDLGSPLLTVAGGVVAMSLQRLQYTAAVLSGREPPLEPSLAFRMSETRHLLAQVRRASWSTRLLGHGLGAASEYPGFGFDGEGRWRRIGRIHYVHNFYVFGLYKLGLVGLILLVSALTLWAGWTAVAARKHRGSPAGRFLAAMAAAWIGYSVWNLVSPEFVNFRIAPIWGLLLACSIRAGSGDRE